MKIRQTIRFGSSILLLLCLMFCIRCNTNVENATEKEVSEKAEDKDVKRNLFNHNKKESECSSNCTTVDISFEQILGNNRFNRSIEKKVIAQLQYFVRDGERLKKIGDLSDAFIKDYKEFKSAFPDAKSSWYLNVEGRITFSSDKLVSYELNTESYTGGADTSYEKALLNMNKNGKEISLKSMVTNRESLMQVAEAAFRKEKGLGPDQDLTQAGFSFENNKFQLPDNIGINENGVVLYYNDYEVGPYEEKATIIEIPFQKIKDALDI